MINVRAVEVLTEGANDDKAVATGGQPWEGLVSLRGLARRLRTLRLRSGWTIDEVADRADISRSTVYQLERGGTPRPRGQTLHRLAEAYGVSIDELLFHDARSGTERSLDRGAHNPGTAAELPLGRWAVGGHPGRAVGGRTDAHRAANAGPQVLSPATQPSATLNGSRPATAGRGVAETESAGVAEARGVAAWTLVALPPTLRGGIEQALAASPATFETWSVTDWNDFAQHWATHHAQSAEDGPTSAGLSPALVLQQARQWQAVRQLQGVLASPLANLAVRLVAELHATAQGAGSLLA